MANVSVSAPSRVMNLRAVLILIPPIRQIEIAADLSAWTYGSGGSGCGSTRGAGIAAGGAAGRPPTTRSSEASV